MTRTDESAVTQHTERRRGRPVLRIALVIVLPAAVMYSVLRLRLGANYACDVGVNAGAAAAGPMALATLLLLVNICVGLLLQLLRNRAVAVVAPILLLLFSSLWFLDTTWPPVGYPSPTCAHNVPSWWPAYLPSR